MNIDDLFKVPKLPAGGKRKLPNHPTPEMLKKMRLDGNGDIHNDSDIRKSDSSSQLHSHKSRRATVEDEAEDSMDTDMDTSFAPGGDADYFAEEDEEGRFYGGGLTAEQKQILSIFESAEGTDGVQDDPEELSITSVRRTLLRFERAANKNQDQRSKYPDDPTKFIDSEADLDAAIKALLPLAQAPVLAYPELINSGAVAKLIGLMSHENADIVIDVVEVIHELTDEDVGDEENDQEESQAALKLLIEALVDNSTLELLVDNFSRLNEDEESDRQGVFHILGVFENVLGFNPDLSTAFVSQTKIMDWLLTRVQAKKQDENRGYAAELLSILLQNNVPNRMELGKKDGVEIILKVLSQFRKMDPRDADEAEFMENLFDALCSALAEPRIKSLFLESEGVDLMVLIMKEKMQAQSRAIKTLDYATSGTTGTEVCMTFVEAYGLKTLFSAFMGKKSKKQKANTAPGSEDISHILGVISSLLSNLPSDTPARIRLLAKFVENGYEKVDRVLEIRDTARSQLRAIEREIERERKDLGAEELEEMEDVWYLRRLDGGLFVLQTVDYILAWVAMEDDGIRAHMTQMLGRKSQSLKDIVESLRIYRDNLDEAPSQQTNSEGRVDQPAEELSQKEILVNLIAFLEGC